MSAGSAECRSCGCHLEHGDVRQLAVYYRSEEASLVAVQYVCPQCGASEWQKYEPEEWAEEALDMAGDWSELTDRLGIIRMDTGADKDRTVPQADQPGTRAFEPQEFTADLSKPIGVDEYIEFGRRMQNMGLPDLKALHGLAP
jgi:predicted RNA-binding Zn-ribbon protein involved in translation (DUF1610 family)